MLEQTKYIDWQFVRNGAAVGLIEAAAILAPLYSHPQQALNALEALRPGYMECADGHTEAYEIQGILVPGAGVHEDEFGNFSPNWQHKEREMAAAILYAQYPDAIIFLLGSPSPRDPDHGQSVVDYLQTAYQEVTQTDENIPEDKIVLDLTSINTATNMEEAYRLAREHDLESFLMVTHSYHMDRSVLFACNTGYLRVTPMVVEEILGIKDRSYSWQTEAKESLEVALAYTDHTGMIPTAIKMHDLNNRQRQHATHEVSFPFRHHPQEIWHEKIFDRNRKETIVYRRNGDKK